MSFEFIDYIATPEEKHLGIARVKAWGKIVLRFKIVPTKDGSSFFPAAASYKIIENGTERYVPAFILDSNSDKEDLESLIKSNVRRFTLGASIDFKGTSKGSADINYPSPVNNTPTAQGFPTQDDLPF